MKIPKRLRRPILIIFHVLIRAIGVMRHCVRRNRRGEYYVTESVVVWPTASEIPTDDPTDSPQTASETPTDDLTDPSKTILKIPTDGLTDSSKTILEIPIDGLTDSLETTSEIPTDDLTDET